MSDEPIREYQSAVRELFKVRADGPALHERDIRRDWQALEAFNRLDAATKKLEAHLSRPPPVTQRDAGRDFGSVPPRWYTQQEIEHCLQRMSYSEAVIAELAPWFHRHIKSAFDKGYNMALGHATPTTPTGHRAVPVEQAGEVVACRIVGRHGPYPWVDGTPDPEFIVGEGERLELAYAKPRPVGVPDGWKLVPVKPTDAMHIAFTRKKYEERDEKSPLLISNLWEAMLAAAPDAGGV